MAESRVLKAFLFVSLLHSSLYDAHLLTGSDQLKDWHAEMHQASKDTDVVVVFLFVEIMLGNPFTTV